MHKPSWSRAVSLIVLHWYVDFCCDEFGQKIESVCACATLSRASATRTAAPTSSSAVRHATARRHSEPDSSLPLSWWDKYVKQWLSCWRRKKCVTATDNTSSRPLKVRSYQRWSLEECSPSVLGNCDKSQPLCVSKKPWDDFLSRKCSGEGQSPQIGRKNGPKFWSFC